MVVQEALGVIGMLNKNLQSRISKSVARAKCQYGLSLNPPFAKVIPLYLTCLNAIIKRPIIGKHDKILTSW